MTSLIKGWIKISESALSLVLLLREQVFEWNIYIYDKKNDKIY
jgi:hypothetical protein